MVRLRLNNPVPDALRHHAPFAHLASEYPVKPRIEPKTARRFQIVSLPQKDGSFVASVVEAPDIVVYEQSRKAAEEKAAKKFLKSPDPYAYKTHPLATTKVVDIDMEYDKAANTFVTHVKELHGMSSFGKTESQALDRTAEMIRGYLKSMIANGLKIPLNRAKLTELKRVVGLT
jgi:predicted RNase H-like HicB family nuclease